MGIQKKQATIRKVNDEEKKKDNEQIEKVRTLRSLASLNTDEDAVHYLNEHQWDLEKAAEAVFALNSDPQITMKNKKVDSALILLLLPDNTTHTFDMQASQTFWELYGQTLRVAPELRRKNFTFVLPDGVALQENEFNQTLEHCGCAPEGSVKV
ncbi:hypothetical protein RFI_30762, partial [Reticulomyxa filosa]